MFEKRHGIYFSGVRLTRRNTLREGKNLQEEFAKHRMERQLRRSEASGAPEAVAEEPAATPFGNGFLGKLYGIYSMIWQIHRLDRMDRKLDMLMQQQQGDRGTAPALEARIAELEQRLAGMGAAQQPSVEVVEWGPYLFGFPSTEWRLAAYVKHRNHPEPGTLRAMQNYLREGMGYVDIGASFGLLTVPAATAVGEKGFVQAWEPDPLSYSILSGNIQLNNLLGNRTVELLPYAAGDRNGRGMLYNNASSRTYGTLGPGDGSEWSGMGVEVRRLDEQLGDRTADLLKIDAEGHEPAVLDGAAKALRSGQVKVMIVEFAPGILQRSGRDAAAWLERLRGKSAGIAEIDESTGGLLEVDNGTLLNRGSTNLWVVTVEGRR
jgi:FkbM family methyltransferase